MAISISRSSRSGLTTKKGSTISVLEIENIEELKPVCKELGAASEIQKRPPNREAEYRVADPDGNLIDLRSTAGRLEKLGAWSRERGATPVAEQRAKGKALRGKSRELGAWSFGQRAKSGAAWSRECGTKRGAVGATGRSPVSDVGAVPPCLPVEGGDDSLH